MSIQVFQKGTNFKSLQSNEIEEHYTLNDFNVNDIPHNSLIEENNSFSSLIEQIFLIKGEQIESLENFNKSNEKLKNSNFSEKKEDEFEQGKKYKESLQFKIKEKIYEKRPFKEKKKFLGRKKKCFEGLGEHNKYSDDNLIRKCKNVILNNIRIFIIIIFKKIY